MHKLFCAGLGCSSLVLLLVACATPLPPTAQHARAPAEPVTEPEALALIDAILVESQVTAVPGWRIELPPQTAIEVDLRLGDSSFGIEWVTPEDRERLGGALPDPDPQGQLRLLSGQAPDAAARPLVLLLDAESYAQSDGAERDARTREHLRKRLQRDVGDFLEYVRGQYPL